MASIRKMPKGYRAEVARLGVRRSKVFATKAEARDWASRQEYLIVNADAVQAKQAFAEVLARYAREVSPKKRGERWEALRINSLRKSDLAKVAISELQPNDFSKWRDKRLREVSAGTVRREMVLLSAVLNVARKEWGLLKVNPLTDVRRPPEPPARERRPEASEMERLALSAGCDLTKATARAYHCFLFAIETAMRASEITRLRWAQVDLDRRVCRLLMTKNGTARDVPLSNEAARLILALPTSDPVFGLTNGQLDILWRKVKNRAGVDGLTFHDSRHEAITRLSRKLDVLALARMVGHRDIRQLMTYYDESAENLAKRLD